MISSWPAHNSAGNVTEPPAGHGVDGPAEHCRAERYESILAVHVDDFWNP